MSMDKSFRLGDRLPYPIAISKILKREGEKVNSREAVLQYTYKTQRTIGDPSLGEEHTITETRIADWNCPTDGTIKHWRVTEGDEISRPRELVVIDEVCSHMVQFAGLCAICGKDMKESNWASETPDTDRATVSMVHDNVALKVSRGEALQAELHLQRRLLRDRKLSLVVDLDQTIIHACIEPTVGEWQKDPNNPNYETVKEVRKFQLDDGPRGLTNGCWYYIKLRPGLKEFLEKVSQLFELHIYTMGTRAYALNIAKLVDPTQRLFGNRLISRDENGSMTAKSLQRLFPVSTNMVVVIDDRADVWPHNRSNLIKVTPYDFFKGIGDINSSFLPKREDIIAPTPVSNPAPANDGQAKPTADPNAAAQQDAKEGDKAPVANTADEDALMQQQAEEQERTLEKQLTDRPLLHLQEKLDKEDEEAEKGSAEQTPDPNPQANGHPEHHRHNLLRDDDQELAYLEQHLSNLHRSFYEQYDARAANRSTKDIDPDVVPDVGSTLSFLKSRVLKGTRIVLSGLVPLGIDVRHSEIGLQAESFGTEIHTRVSDDITHLVISSSRPRTSKVRQAARIRSIKIVNQDWLADSLAQWKKLDETPYLIPIAESDRHDTRPIKMPKIKIDTGRATGGPVASNGMDELQDIVDNSDESDSDSSASSPGHSENGEEGRDRYNVMPRELEDGESSPVDGLESMQWDSVDQELADFMGSDMDDDDDGETGDDDSEADTNSSKGKKRKAEDEAGAGPGGSVLSKKQRLAKSRTTGLRNVKNAGEEGEEEEAEGLPTPMGTGDEEDAGGQGDKANDDVRGGDGAEDENEEEMDDEALALEAELLEAELEAQIDDEENG